jgi:7-cyano-7-deazaguanine synthase
LKTVVLLSGGLDSTTLAYYLVKELDMDIATLSFDYGQRHGPKELEAARRTARNMGVEHRHAELPRSLFAGSALTSLDVDVPEGHYADDNMAITIVPNRNAVMLSLAFALAESLKFDAVAYAAHAGDHAVYPDCRPEFMVAFQEMQDLALGRHVELIRPFAEKTKADIVSIGEVLDVPFELTWSCYKGGEIHCGKCATCVERQEAFSLAGVDDPTEYLDATFWREAVAQQSR